MNDRPPTLVAFVGTYLLARGPAAEVVRACKRRPTEPPSLRLAIYLEPSGQVLDIDLSGDEAAVLARLASHPRLAGGRIEEDTGSPYRRPKTARRRAADAAYRFMQDLVGDIAGFEEASRALFAGDRGAFERETATWPRDVREQLARFLSEATPSRF